jgi:hypothetical protein
MILTWTGVQRSVIAATATILAIAGSSAVAPAVRAAVPGVALAVHSVAQPTRFQPADPRDMYTILVENVGSKTSSSGELITVTDTLPAGVTTSGEPARHGEGVAGLECPEAAGLTVVTCTFEVPIPPLTQAAKAIGIPVTVSPEAVGPLINSVTVSGGGASTSAATSEETQLESPSLPALQFGPLGFEASALDAGGRLDTQAAAHPGGLATIFHFTTAFGDKGLNPGKPSVLSLEDAKHVVVDLPPGVVGDALAAPTCSLTELEAATGTEGATRPGCKAATRVGTLAEFVGVESNGREEAGGSPDLEVFNVTPEHGYPAEFGAYDPVYQKAQLLYARIVGSGAGTHVQVISGPLTQFISFTGFSTIFFGDPAERDNTGEAPRAFFSNPSDCSQTGFTTVLHLDSWQHPGRFKPDGTPDFSDPNWKPAEARSPAVNGCEVLQFHPTLSLAPEAEHSQPDEPSGYQVNLRVPQSEDPNNLATPPLKTAVVTLPPGVAISPAAANGLVGCQETGPEGIELQSVTRGDCPSASTLGEAEVLTPLLKEPLKGDVYLAQPTCGGIGQPECTEEAAETGGVFALDLEVGSDNSGVHIKLKGKVEVGGNGQHSREAGLQPGQVRTTFTETPQQPFSELKLRLNGGPRAPLANPQICGAFTTMSALTPWSSTTEAAVQPSAPFVIGGCVNQFVPGFTAGTVNPQAAAFSPFTLTFSRHDREQDLSGITVHMPPGLLGKIAGTPQCPEAQADAGSCSAASRVGTATAAAGSGSNPLWQSGPVYLTGPYKGAPFGLSIAVPAKAGPFNLGTIVVRAAIYVDPHTAALNVVSDPLPQSVDGVPLRLQTVNVTVDREGFMFNPTSCEPTQVAATLTSLQGTTVPVASRFQAANCASLPFKPAFSATTAGNGGFHGASLDVKISQKPGEAAIHKVDTQLPIALPSRLVTLQKACTETQFAANPAGCPPGSSVGIATATTPVLNVPLTGPAYLVSHGGAAFPDLDIILQGEGVTIDLVGNTDIKKGITFSRFETVPDAPITSFELNLPGGPGAVLGAIKNLCALTRTVTVTKHVALRHHGHVVRRHGRVVRVLKKVKHSVAEPLLMPTTITGQNGAVVKQTTKITVTGCAKPKAKKKAKPKKAGKAHKGKRR